VDEVIKKRLLEKKPEVSESLQSFYEEKKIVQLDLQSGKQLTKCNIYFTQFGEGMYKQLLKDLVFIRNAYNRSRNQKIRNFLIKYLE